MSLEEKYRFYGCYLGNYEKTYRWQCKIFESEREATLFSNMKADEAMSPLTMLVPVEKYVPEMFHHYKIQKVIRQLTNVDILQK